MKKYFYLVFIISIVSISCSSQKSGKEFYKEFEASYRQGEFNDALKFIKEAIKIDPQNLEFHFSLATLSDELKLYQQAIEACNHCIEIDSAYCEAYYFKSTILITMKKYDEAFKSTNDGIIHCPNYPKLFYGRALLKKYRNDSDFCDDFKIADSLGFKIKEQNYLKENCDPDFINKSELVKKAYWNYIKIKPDSTISLLKREFTNNPQSKNDNSVLLLMARSYWYQSKFDSAVKYFQMVPLKDINYIMHLFDYSQSLYQLQEFSKAKTVLLQAIEIERLDKLIFSLALCEHNLNNQDNALQLTNEALLASPDNPMYLEGKGRILYELGERTNACSAWEQSLSLGNHNVKILLQQLCE